MSVINNHQKLPIYKVSINFSLSILYAVLITLALILSIKHEIVDHTQFQLHMWMLAFLGLSFVLVLSCFKTEIVSRKISFLFVLSLFSLLTAMRISMLGNYFDVFLTTAIAALVKIAILFDIAKKDIYSHGKAQEQYIKRLDWQVLMVRLLIGLVLVPHFTEKLFAGPMVRGDDVAAFASMGITQPVFFVILAGLCEFFGSLAVSCGFFTRLSSLCVLIYLMVATYLGGHFDNGFIWAGAGGGWEYPVLWAALLLCFSFFGPGYFSIDQYLCSKYTLPKWVVKVMGVK